METRNTMPSSPLLFGSNSKTKNKCHLSSYWKETLSLEETEWVRRMEQAVGLSIWQTHLSHSSFLTLLSHGLEGQVGKPSGTQFAAVLGSLQCSQAPG